MMKENWVYCRGDIYCANLDPVVGSEQGGIRPVIVIQNDTGNKHAPTLIVATVTTRIHKKANMPTHFVIYDNPAFKEASVVQLEQIRTIDKSRIDNYLGKVNQLHIASAFARWVCDLPGEICCFLRFFGAGRGRHIAASERSGLSSFIFSLSRRSGVRR